MQLMLIDVCIVGLNGLSKLWGQKKLNSRYNGLGPQGLECMRIEAE